MGGIMPLQIYILISSLFTLFKMTLFGNRVVADIIEVILEHRGPLIKWMFLQKGET